MLYGQPEVQVKWRRGEKVPVRREPGAPVLVTLTTRVTVLPRGMEPKMAVLGLKEKSGMAAPMVSVTVAGVLSTPTEFVTTNVHVCVCVIGRPAHVCGPLLYCVGPPLAPGIGALAQGGREVSVLLKLHAPEIAPVEVISRVKVVPDVIVALFVPLGVTLAAVMLGEGGLFTVTVMVC